MTLEENTHQFIVQVWTEEGEDPLDSTELHGHVTHVLSRKRIGVTDFEAVVAFMKSYIERRNDDFTSSLAT